jgi:hypothetical protein
LDPFYDLPLCLKHQGFPRDNSDDEWDDHIQHQYGAAEPRIPRASYMNEDGALDLQAYLQETFDIGNGNHNAAMQDLPDAHFADGGGLEDFTDSEEKDFGGGPHPNVTPQRGKGQHVPDDDHDLLSSDDNEEVRNVEDNEYANMGAGQAMDDVYDRMQEIAAVPLFENSTLTSLSTTLLILNACRTHRCTSAFVSELFRLLHQSVLPQPNTLPVSKYEASLQLRRLGLLYCQYDVCPNNCMLFRGPVGWRLAACSTCASQYKRPGTTMIPHKVLRHFLVIPRLRRMFCSPAQASLMTWHAENRSTDGMVRHASDSRQWRHVDERWPGFGQEARDVRLGLAMDGINPFSEKCSTHSTWPILLLNYNLPPGL